MKLVVAVLLLLISLPLLAAKKPVDVALEKCKAEFQAKVFETYEGTTAETVRMSRRVNVQRFEAKDENLVLMTLLANFKVKWARNKGEVSELAGGNYVYNKSNNTCESMMIRAFYELQKK